MKIAIIQGAFFPVPPIRGGAVEKLWYQLGIEFSRRGHLVTHISRLCDGLPKYESIEGVRHIRVRSYDQPGNGFYMKWLDLNYSMRAVRIMPSSDIVVTNTFWMPILLRSHPGVYVSVQRMPKGQIRLYGKSARLHACSSAVLRAILEESPKAGPRVCMIPNPLGAIPKREVNWNTKRNRMLYVGRIHPEKGIEMLLKAFIFAKSAGFLDQWTLEIVGPSDVSRGGGGSAWKNGLMTRFSRDDIIWHEPIYDNDKLAEFYEKASVFVYPSIAEKGETFGLAVLEAMAWGAVPVVSALDCFRDYLVPGKNGFIFDHRSAQRVEILARQLGKAASSNLRNMAEEASRVRETHAVGSVANQFLSDFELLRRSDANL